MQRLLVISALAIHTLSFSAAQIPQPPQVFTVHAGERARIWFGVFAIGTVYLRINNSNNNCAKFYWTYAFIKRSVGTLCNDIQLKNLSPIAALWIDRPESVTAVALSDDVRALDLTPLCKVGVPCPFKP